MAAKHRKSGLPASSYTLDFYLRLRFNTSDVNPKEFEFINGKPAVDKIHEEEGYLEYRVRGVFVKHLISAVILLTLTSSSLNLKIKG